MNLGDTRVGSQDVADGAIVPLRSGRYGDLFTNSGMGRFYALAKQGKLFCASMQAAANFGTALTATAVTITLYNPSSSGVDLVLLATDFQMGSVGQTTTTNAPIVVYAANLDTSAAAPATNTAITVRNAFLGGSAGTGVVYSATTLPSAPIIVRVHPWAHVCQTGGTVVQSSQANGYDNVDGAIVLRPNTAVTLQGIATTTQIAGIASMLWAEITI